MHQLNGVFAPAAWPIVPPASCRNICVLWPIELIYYGKKKNPRHICNYTNYKEYPWWSREPPPCNKAYNNENRSFHQCVRVFCPCFLVASAELLSITLMGSSKAENIPVSLMCVEKYGLRRFVDESRFVATLRGYRNGNRGPWIIDH